MTVNELIDKLTEIKNSGHGHDEIEIWAENDDDFHYCEIESVFFNNGNEEEFVSDRVTIKTIITD